MECYESSKSGYPTVASQLCTILKACLKDARSETYAYFGCVLLITGQKWTMIRGSQMVLKSGMSKMRLIHQHPFLGYRFRPQDLINI